MYNLDGNEGGDLTLLKQHRLDGRTEDTHKTSSQVDGAAGRSDPQPIGARPDGGKYYIRLIFLIISLSIWVITILAGVKLSMLCYIMNMTLLLVAWIASLMYVATSQSLSFTSLLGSITSRFGNDEVVSDTESEQDSSSNEQYISDSESIETLSDNLLDADIENSFI